MESYVSSRESSVAWMCCEKVSTWLFLFLSENLCCSYSYRHKAEHSDPDPAKHLLYFKPTQNFTDAKAVYSVPESSSPSLLVS